MAQKSSKKADKKTYIEQFKQGIFSLRTNFGELSQLMIQIDFGLQPSEDNSYDLKDAAGNRFEVKFSRAYKKSVPITANNAIEVCMNCSSTVYALSEAEKAGANYDCNIQQLKPRCFDYLYYGVFFSDKVEIFCAPRADFPSNVEAFAANKSSARKKLPGYALQHKGGEECQFHIKRTTHKHHRENYHVKDITYEDLYELLASKK